MCSLRVLLHTVAEMTENSFVSPYLRIDLKEEATKRVIIFNYSVVDFPPIVDMKPYSSDIFFAYLDSFSLQSYGIFRIFSFSHLHIKVRTHIPDTSVNIRQR